MTHLMRDVAPQISCSTTTAARTDPRGTQTVIDTPLGVAAANDPGWPANDEGTSASNHAPKQLDANSSAPTRQVAGPCVESRRLEREVQGRAPFAAAPSRGRDNDLCGATARHVGQPAARMDSPICA
jgi:hypothetical protein